MTPRQLGAMVNAADVNNPSLVLTAAYVAKNGVHGHRAKQEGLLDRKNIHLEYDTAGKVIGSSSDIGLTKVDRLQVGERKPLQCTDDCTGELMFDEEGRIDANLLCPHHLLMFALGLVAEKLGVGPESLIECPLFADFMKPQDVTSKYEIVVHTADSPILKMKEAGELKPRVNVIMKAEEVAMAKSDLERVVCFDGELRAHRPGRFFEVPGQLIVVRSWGGAQVSEGSDQSQRGGQIRVREFRLESESW